MSNNQFASEGTGSHAAYSPNAKEDSISALVTGKRLYAAKGGHCLAD